MGGGSPTPNWGLSSLVPPSAAKQPMKWGHGFLLQSVTLTTLLPVRAAHQLVGLENHLMARLEKTVPLEGKVTLEKLSAFTPHLRFLPFPNSTLHRLHTPNFQEFSNSNIWEMWGGYAFQCVQKYIC